MEKFYEVLKRCTLLNDINREEYEEFLKELKATIQYYHKRQTILEFGEDYEKIGIVVSGIVFAMKIDLNGQRRIIAELKQGDSFGESLAFMNILKSPVTLITSTEVTVLMIPATNIREIVKSNWKYKETFNMMLIKLIARKNLILQIRNNILSKNTTREKTLAYLAYKKSEANRDSFQIPFNREELADYLSLNRSALSRELGKMKREGLITFSKKTFVLKNDFSEKMFYS